MSVENGPLTGLVRTAPPPPSRERTELAATVRAMLTRHPPAAERVADAPGGYDAGLWQRLRDLGVPGLAVPAELGGLGGDYLDCHAVLVELGREVAASPVLATLLATQAALLAGPGRLPAGLADGGATGALAEGLTASGPAGGWLLGGAADLVLDGGRADVLLAVADAGDGPALFALRPGGFRADVLTTMDRAIHLAAVRAESSPADRLGAFPAAAADRLTALRAVALSAAQVGGARRCLELTVEHAGRRVQFDRPIGSFQAVKHRLADLLVLVEAAESASWSAAAAWAAGAPDAGLLADVAGSYCGEAYLRVAAETVQLHGGIAITWEHPAHRYFKHAHTTATLFGTPERHRDRLAALLRGRVHPAEL